MVLKSSFYNKLLFYKKKDSHRFFKRVINAYLFVKAYKLELPFSFWKQTLTFGPQQVQATSTNKKDTCSQFYNLLLPNTSTQQYTYSVVLPSRTMLAALATAVILKFSKLIQ